MSGKPRIGSLKAVALVFSVALVALAATASAAFGAAYKSETAAPATTWVSGVSEANHTFNIGLSVTCTTATVEGSFVDGATTLNLSPTYAGCTVEKKLAVTIKTNGCTFELGEPQGASSPFTVKAVTIKCPAGKEMEISPNGVGCAVKIKPQTVGTATVTNFAGPPKGFFVGMNLTKITAEGNGGICGGKVEEGTYSGTFKVRGFKNEKRTEATGIFAG